MRPPGLIDELALSRGDGRIAARTKSLASIELLVLDDCGLGCSMTMPGMICSKSSETAMDGAQSLSRASFPSRAGWIVGYPTYVYAIFDRLVNKAHRLKQLGNSTRRLAEVAPA